MISWQALALNGYLRLALKRGGKRPIDPRHARAVAAGSTRFQGGDMTGYEICNLRTDGGLRFALLTASDTPLQTAACIVLYLHGGGYILGSPQTHRAAALATARAFSAPVYVLDYRLAPEHPFPAAIEDAVGAYQWLLAKHPDSSIVLVGDSAGGGLAVATAVSTRARGLWPPAGLVAFSAWCDLAMTGSSIEANARSCAMLTSQGVRQAAAMYLAGADPRDPRASPLYADLTGMPPMLLFASCDELLLDDTVRLAERARAAGVTVTLDLRDRLPHAWPIFVSLLPEARDTFAAVGDFARQLRPRVCAPDHAD